ncbi:hypothetical protein [Paraburkholderia terrae]
MAQDSKHNHESRAQGLKPCAPVSDLRRLNYFFGQMLGVDDFRSEQNYFREKHKLHNRCLHGYGTVCGLLVMPELPEKPCTSKQDDERARLEEKIAQSKKELQDNPDWPQEKKESTKADIEEMCRAIDCLPKPCLLPPIRPQVLVECGIALDCVGNEIIVRHTETLDLWERLSREERERLANEPHDVYVSVCFCEKPVSPVRPVQEASCEPNSGCVYGKLQDSYRFRVSLTRPERDRRCEPCCSGCEECCLLLARIGSVRATGDIENAQIDNNVRRRVGLYESTRIEGINWTHGATYEIEEVDDLLGGKFSGHEHDGGLVLQTSHGVNMHTLRRGVVDVWVIRGGRGSHAEIYNLDTKIIPMQPDAEGYVRRFRVRSLSDEKLDNGDRVIITVRGAFILDRCCQPLDGVNVGGFVPTLPDEQFRRFHKQMPPPVCDRDPYGPPRSGFGLPSGSNFESWFFVYRRDEGRQDMHSHYDKFGMPKGE